MKKPNRPSYFEVYRPTFAMLTKFANKGMHYYRLSLTFYDPNLHYTQSIISNQTSVNSVN
jgi:hypothetical protein